LLLNFSGVFGLAAAQVDLQRLLNYLLLVLSIVAGVIFGMLADRLIDLSLGRETAVLVGPVSRQTELPRLTEDDFQVILKRNLFNSEATGEAIDSIDFASKIVTVPDGNASAKPMGSLTLIGTVVAGENSLALGKSGTKNKVFRLNEEISPGVIVSEIGRKLVVIKDHGVRRELPLKAQKGAKAQRIRQKRAGTARGGVVAVDDNRWKISKTVIDGARANLNSLLQSARMVPQVKNGKTVGFKLVELEKGSLLEQIGLKVGDLIVEINQVQLNSPEKALQVFQQVREANNITLGLIRNGNPETFEYSFE
jgi:general secretion pathway protein C